jgi:molecular chaperone Hsp33
MLRMLGHDEVRSVIAERGEVEVHCEFCNRRYAFDAIDSEQIFAAAVPAPPGRTRH